MSDSLSNSLTLGQFSTGSGQNPTSFDNSGLGLDTAMGINPFGGSLFGSATSMGGGGSSGGGGLFGPSTFGNILSGLGLAGSLFGQGGLFGNNSGNSQISGGLASTGNTYQNLINTLSGAFQNTAMPLMNQNAGVSSGILNQLGPYLNNNLTSLLNQIANPQLNNAAITQALGSVQQLAAGKERAGLNQLGMAGQPLNEGMAANLESSIGQESLQAYQQALAPLLVNYQNMINQAPMNVLSAIGPLLGGVNSTISGLDPLLSGSLTGLGGLGNLLMNQQNAQAAAAQAQAQGYGSLLGQGIGMNQQQQQNNQNNNPLSFLGPIGSILGIFGL